MKEGQICVIKSSGSKGQIFLIDNHTVHIRVINWLRLNKGNIVHYNISHFQRLINDGIIRVYDELPAGNPNLLFKSK